MKRSRVKPLGVQVKDINVFISHIHEELEIAQAVRMQLNKCFGSQVNTFLAEDIELGSNWFENIRNALAKADRILALFSPHSLSRPWINIEAGYGIMANKNVIPICCLGLQKSDLPVVYQFQQAMHIDDPIDVDRLLGGIAASTSAGCLLVDKVAALENWQNSIAAALTSTSASYREANRWLVPINSESKNCFHIVNKATGGCLDIERWAKTDGAAIIQFPYHGGDNQLWQIRPMDPPYYTLISKHSNKCLEVKDSSDAEGAAIVQRDYKNQTNQQWDFTKLQDGSYKITARHSGKCLSRQETDRSILQNTWHDLGLQRWWLKVNITPI